jgi:hypothetical protein
MRFQVNPDDGTILAQNDTSFYERFGMWKFDSLLYYFENGD